MYSYVEKCMALNLHFADIFKCVLIDSHRERRNSNAISATWVWVRQDKGINWRVSWGHMNDLVAGPSVKCRMRSWVATANIPRPLLALFLLEWLWLLDLSAVKEKWGLEGCRRVWFWWESSRGSSYSCSVPFSSPFPSLHPAYVHRNTTMLPQSGQGGSKAEQVSTEFSVMLQMLSPLWLAESGSLT